MMGQGSHTDIIQASALAYLNALNKLEYRRLRRRAAHDVPRSVRDATPRSRSSPATASARRSPPRRSPALELVAPRHGVELASRSRAASAARRSTPPASRSPPAELERARAPTPCCSAPSAGPSGTIRRRRVRPEQALLGLRKGLGVYANLRPVWTVPALVRSSALRPEVLEGVDLVVIRELTGGIYFGQPSERRTTAPRAARRSTRCLYTEAEIARLVRAGFAARARSAGRRSRRSTRRTSCPTSRLWREVAHRGRARVSRRRVRERPGRRDGDAL